MLHFNSILFYLASIASVVHALNFTAYKDKNCLEEDKWNSISDGRIDPVSGCSGVTKKGPTTAFKIDVSGDWSSCTVNLMRANSSTHTYTSDELCHLGLLDEDWIRDSKNGTCYQYSDWDKYSLADCDDKANEQWRNELAMKGKNIHTITIVGAVVGSVVGVLLILSVVYWRRQKKRERARGHGKVHEVQPIELNDPFKP